jgi:hypothetical protein
MTQGDLVEPSEAVAQKPSFAYTYLDPLKKVDQSCRERLEDLITHDEVEKHWLLKQRDSWPMAPRTCSALDRTACQAKEG